MHLIYQRKQVCFTLVGIALLCTLIVSGMISLAEPLFSDWENKTLDYRFKLRGNLPVNPQIILIDIDDQSIAQIGRWPWPRSIHAEMIDILSQSAAAVIGYDILFSQPTTESEDNTLETAIQNAGNVHLPIGFELEAGPKISALPTVRREIGPIPKLRAAAAGMGHISSNRDADGTIRRVPLLVNREGTAFPAFAIALLQGYLDAALKDDALTGKNQLVLLGKGRDNQAKKITIPVNQQGMMLINYAGPWTATFDHYSFADIRQAWKDPKNHKDLKKTFQGKILLISNSATGYDLKPIPIEPDYPGGGIHANAINTILDEHFIQNLEPGPVFAISLFLSIIVSGIIFNIRNGASLPVCLVVVFLYVLSGVLFFKNGLNLPVLFPVLSMCFTALSAVVYQNILSRFHVSRLAEEKTIISAQFLEVKKALEANTAKLASKRKSLTRLMTAVKSAKGKEAEKTRQIEEMRQELARADLKQKTLLKEKSALEHKINDFSIAKIEKGKPLEAPWEDLKEEARRCGIVTQNKDMLKAFERIKKTARTTQPILILGETGTGKELMARAVHTLASDTKKELVVVNIPAIPETLMDRELFGHTRGAFSDAKSDKPGKFQEADGGTLFLDEIGELPLNFQAKLLRAIETGAIDRIGATRPERVHVKIVSATNRLLYEEMQAKRFRQDLFFRLDGIRVTLPPLRERKEDLELLVDFFIQKNALELKQRPKALSKKAMARIKAHDWPGNVRELANVIGKGFALASGGTVTEADLELQGMHVQPEQTEHPRENPSESPRSEAPAPPDKDLSDATFLALLMKNKFNKTKTATELKVQPLTVGSRFRGICLKTLAAHGGDVEKAAAALSNGNHDPQKMAGIIRTYHQNLIKSVAHFEKSEEAIQKSQDLFKNIKKKYHPSLERLIRTYFESRQEVEP
ncbi:MAG: sigma 54-interacting transcriptional regulator [Nitrospiria bacterium]